jgi:O-antigen/teichoic acid export membrane protein
VFIVSDKLVFLFTSVMAQVLRVVTAFVMARLLIPEDYGLLTLISVAPGFFAALGDCGIARALVQYRDLPNDITEATGLVISGSLGIICAVIFVVSAGYIYQHGYSFRGAWVRYDGRLPWIGLVMGATVLLASIYNFQMACLNRDLKFRAESFQNIIFAAAQAVTGLSIALAAHWHPRIGVFALALQPLVAQILGNAVIYHRHPFAWPRAFQFSMARRMLNYGWKVTLAQYVGTVQQSVISAVVVFFGGTYGAGIYGRATQISDMIGFNLMGSFDRLLHPMLRAVRDEQERLRSIFIRGCIGITLIGAFGWAWLVGTAPDLIRVIIGDQWGDVPPLLRVVCSALAINGLGTMGFAAINALGKPLVWLRLAIVNLAMLLLLTGILTFFRARLNQPLLGVAGAYAFCQIIYTQQAWAWAMRNLKIRRRELVWHIARLVGAAILACACMLLIRHGMLGASSFLRLMIASSAGLAAFAGVVFIVDREAILDFRTLVRRRLPAQPPAPLTDAGAVWPLEHVSTGAIESPHADEMKT